MKVKLIRCEDLEMLGEKFENEINEFMRNKKVIDIKYQEFLDIDEGIENASYGSGVFGSVLIIYEE